MRIGIDARELCGHRTGVGRYLAGLLQEWSCADRARCHEFILYAPQPHGIALDDRRFPTRIVAGTGGTRWEQHQLPAKISRDHLDVFFAPGYTAPLFSRVPLVVAIHDVSFAAHPEWFSAREGLRRRLMTRRTASVARAVTTLSEFSKRELVELLHVPESKIHIIRPGVSIPNPQPPAPRRDPSLQPPAPGPQPRVLYVGSIFNRRHLPDLIRAFGDLVRHCPEAQLDLVGEDRTHPREDIVAAISRERAGDHIQWHRYVSDAELTALYGAARAFAFLSEYEGLGLTPLEAMARGVPSVLLETPVAREACGAAALYVRKGDLAATTDALKQLLFDDIVRGRLLRDAPGVLAKYDWPRAATETLAVLEGAV